MLLTAARGNPRGLECTACPWSQYPGHAPELSSTPESRKEAAAQLEREAAAHRERMAESPDSRKFPPKNAKTPKSDAPGCPQSDDSDPERAHP